MNVRNEFPLSDLVLAAYIASGIHFGVSVGAHTHDSSLMCVSPMTALKSARLFLSSLTQGVTARGKPSFPIVALCVSNSGIH